MKDGFCLYCGRLGEGDWCDLCGKTERVGSWGASRAPRLERKLDTTPHVITELELMIERIRNHMSYRPLKTEQIGLMVLEERIEQLRSRQ